MAAGGISSGYGAPSSRRSWRWYVSLGYAAPSSGGHGGGSVSSGYVAPSSGGHGGGSVSSGYAAPSSSYSRSSHYGKRSAELPRAIVPDPEAIFSLVASLDVHSCGKQLICELEAKNSTELEEDELLMLSLFGKNNKKMKYNPKSHKAEYDLAAELGLISKSQALCRSRYTDCPYTAEELMSALRQNNF
uniref:Uncharacterized protein n=1 Tax=Lepeophtheirus salmonis TaxID=72036 RepID=A7TZ33_LEPSM|nr:hypothetical protein [Lepeophtheirus salmonis]